MGEACYSEQANSAFGACQAPPLVCASVEDEDRLRCREAATGENQECVGPSEATIYGRKWSTEITRSGSCGSAGVPHIWTFTVPDGEGGLYGIAASGGRDPVLHVHWACESRLETELGCDDDGGPGLESTLILPLEAGQTIYAYTHEYSGGSAENISLEIWRVGP